MTGTRTDVEGTADAVRRWWPGDSTVEVAAEVLPTKVTADELARVKAEFGDIAVSGPVTVKAGEKSFTLTPKQLAPAVVLAADDAGPHHAARRRQEALVDRARRGEEGRRRGRGQGRGGDLLRSHADVKAHVAGLELDDASVRSEVWTALGGSAEARTATVTTKATQPTLHDGHREEDAAEGDDLLLHDVLPARPAAGAQHQAGRRARSTARTSRRAEQFSMNAVLGQRTPAKGYVEAGIIRNGRAAESVGGGISQVSTTIFNASFFAGVQLDAWTPHYYYISRYPEGREATISWPDLHNKFTNTTDGGILIQVATTDTSITVSYWGTKKYDVSATKSARYDIVQPKKYTDDGPDCLNQSPVVGFKVDIGRVFKQGGKVVKTERFTTTYRPEDDVTCTNPKPDARGSSTPAATSGEVDVLVVALEPTPLVEREGFDVVRIGLQVQRRGTVVRGGHREGRQHP